MYNRIKKYNRLLRIYSLIVLATCGCCLTACYDNDAVGDAFLTTSGELKDEMLSYYIAKHPETYSLYERALQITGLEEIFKSYGRYTCFLPDNTAMTEWLKEQGKTSIDACDPKVLDNLVRFHTIDGAKDNRLFTRENLPNGTLTVNNMADRSIMTSFKEIAKGYILVNGKAKMIATDSLCKNGVAHTIDQVLQPIEKTVTEILAGESRYSIFNEALLKTGLDQKMQVFRDEEGYADPGNSLNLYVRYYKYTIFVEPNEVYQQAGIQSYDDLVNKLNLNDGKQPTDTTSAVYRFVAYHCLPVGRFSGEFYEEPLATMCPNSLLDISIPDVKPLRQVTAAKTEESKEALNICYDYWPKAAKYLNGNIAISAADEAAVNGVVHEISTILNVGKQESNGWSNFKKRLRFDVAGICHATMNNSLFHFPGNANNSNKTMVLPADFLKPQIRMGNEGKVSYVQNREAHALYFDFITFKGWYDVTIQTPPIPAGKWEARASFSYSGNRGWGQFFFDGNVAGMPVFFGDIWGGSYGGATNADMGANEVGSAKDLARTRQMRNNACMPYPAGVTYYNGGSAYLKQKTPGMLRRILGTFTFDEMKSHEIRVKSMSEDSEWQIDFIEFIPADQVINEDIY